MRERERKRESNRNTSHVFNCHPCDPSELRQAVMVAPSSNCLIVLFSDLISYDHRLDQCTQCVCCWNHFFKTGESVTATRKVFPVHFMFGRNDAVPDRKLILLWVKNSTIKTNRLENIMLTPKMQKLLYAWEKYFVSEESCGSKIVFYIKLLDNSVISSLEKETLKLSLE